MTSVPDRLPYWPAALNQKMAAAYCGISVETFTKVCPVKPISFTNSSWGNRYLRQRLDEWMLSLDTNGPIEPRRKRFGDYLKASAEEKEKRRQRS